MIEKELASVAAPPADGIAAAGRQDTGATRFLLLLGAYGLAYLMLRLQLGGALERDEAEIVYLVQELRPGYGPQPPLYAWLQWLAFSVFGVNRFALVLPKDLLLLGSYALMYRAARPLLGTQGALAAAAALALFPQIGWESLRIQTHSVLAASIACATLWAYVALLERPGPARWLAIGLLCGLGLQAKYNVGVFLAALAGASLLVPGHRRRLWNRATAPAALAGALLALALLLPHAAWMLGHPQAAFAETVHKMQDGMAEASYVGRVLAGLGKVLLSVASFAALPLLVFAVLAWPLRRRLRIERHMPSARWFLVLHALLLALLGLLALSGQVGTIKERWMIPLLFALPLAAFVVLPALRTRTVYLRARRAGMAAALLWLALLPARHYLGSASGEVAGAHHPYAALAQALHRACPDAATVVTDSLSAAGNLRFADPSWRVVLQGGALGEALPASGRVALAVPAPGGAAALARLRGQLPGARLLWREHRRFPIGRGTGQAMEFELACLARPAMALNFPQLNLENRESHL